MSDCNQSEYGWAKIKPAKHFSFVNGADNETCVQECGATGFSMKYSVKGKVRDVCKPKCEEGQFHYFDPKTMNDLTDDQQRCEGAHNGRCKEGYLMIGPHICAKMSCADY